MKVRFVKSPFDLAVGLARFERSSWILLASSIAFTVICLAFAWHATARLRAIESVQSQLAERQEKERAAAENDKKTAQTPQALEAQQALLRINGLLKTPWGALMNALESAAKDVSGKVILLSLAPSMKVEALPTAAPGTPIGRIEINAQATSAEAMFDYISALPRTGAIDRVQLKSHQLEPKLGSGALKFHLVSTWISPNPQTPIQATSADSPTSAASSASIAASAPNPVDTAASAPEPQTQQTAPSTSNTQDVASTIRRIDNKTLPVAANTSPPKTKTQNPRRSASGKPASDSRPSSVTKPARSS